MKVDHGGRHDADELLRDITEDEVICIVLYEKLLFDLVVLCSCTLSLMC